MRKIFTTAKIGLCLNPAEYFYYSDGAYTKYSLPDFEEKTKSMTDSEKFAFCLSEIKKRFPKKLFSRYQLLFAISDEATQDVVDSCKEIFAKQHYFKSLDFISPSLCVISAFEAASRSIFIYKSGGEHYGCAGFFGSMTAKSVKLNNIKNIDECIDSIIQRQVKKLPEEMKNAILCTVNGVEQVFALKDENYDIHALNSTYKNVRKLADIWNENKIDNIFISTDEEIDCSNSNYKDIIKKSYKPDIILDGMMSYCKYLDNLYNEK